MAVKKTGFAVTVEGQYVVSSVIGRNNVQEKKNYKVVVNVPKYGQNTLSIIKNRLLESAIRKFDPAYKTYVTHSITGVQPLGDPEETTLTGRLLTTNIMSVAQLVKYVQGQKLPVAIHLYEQDILEFRKAIDSCKADQKKFLAKQKKLQEDYEIQKELQELNPDLETKGDVKISSTPSEAVRLTPEVFTNAIGERKTISTEPVKELTNAEIVEAANVESEKEVEEAGASSEVVSEDEEFLTDGSETFERASEAPYPDNIDEEVPDEVDEDAVAAVLAANANATTEDGGDLVKDL